MDHLSTPGSAPAAFASRRATLASRPATFASAPAAAPRTVGAGIASTGVAAAAGSATESDARANYQDALLFIAPPLLSAVVLGALSVNLHRIPSAHPLYRLVVHQFYLRALLRSIFARFEPQR